MDNWYMLALVGKDRPGIVARITGTLFEGGGNVGEASMTRLGDSFTVMMMVRFDGDKHALRALLEPVSQPLGLQLHIDNIDGRLHQHVEPDVRISVLGADRAGIVAQVTGAMAEAGLNICNLETDVGGSEAHPIYIMHIEGQALHGVDRLHDAAQALLDKGVEVTVSEIDALIG